MALVDMLSEKEINGNGQSLHTILQYLEEVHNNTISVVKNAIKKDAAGEKYKKKMIITSR